MARGTWTASGTAASALVLGALTACGTSASDEQLEDARTWFAEEAPHVASVERLDQDRWDFSHGSDQPVRVAVTLDEGSGPAEVAELAEAQGERFAEDGGDGIAVLITTVTAGDLSADIDLDRAHNEAVVAFLEAAQGLETQSVFVRCTGAESCDPAEATVRVDEPSRIAPTAGSLVESLGEVPLELVVESGLSSLGGDLDAAAVQYVADLAATPGVRSWTVDVDRTPGDGPHAVVRVDPDALVRVRPALTGLGSGDLRVEAGPFTVDGREPLPALRQVTETLTGLPGLGANLSSDGESAGQVNVTGGPALRTALASALDPAGTDRPVTVRDGGAVVSVTGTRAEREAVLPLVGSVPIGDLLRSMEVSGDRIGLLVRSPRPADVTEVVEAVRAADLPGEFTWRLWTLDGGPDVTFRSGTDGDARDAEHTDGGGLSDTERSLVALWDRTP